MRPCWKMRQLVMEAGRVLLTLEPYQQELPDTKSQLGTMSMEEWCNSSSSSSSSDSSRERAA